MLDGQSTEVTPLFPVFSMVYVGKPSIYTYFYLVWSIFPCS